MNKPLTGIRVVDCTFFAAGPACGKCLADWGANVIKVEPPRGDPSRNKDPSNPIFENHNNSKRGIVINSKTAEGTKLMDDLIATSDVFLTSYRTDALKKLGWDYDTLSNKYPKLVWAQVNGFGDEGPDAAAPGFDTVAYWARSGLMNDFVDKGSPIVIPPVGFGDMSTGAQLAGGIAAALFARERTGKGDKVMISLLGGAIHGLSWAVLKTQLGEVTLPTSRYAPAVPLMNSYKCRDGKWIYLAALEHERYLPVVAKLIGREDIVDNPKYNTRPSATANIEEFTKIIDEGFAKYTQAEWLDMLVKADVAHSTVNQCVDIIKDPQAIANNYIQEFTFRNGNKVYFASTPLKFGNIELDELTNAPLLGEHTVDIMKELKYPDAQIEEFIEKGIVTAVK